MAKPWLQIGDYPVLMDLPNHFEKFSDLKAGPFRSPRKQISLMDTTIFRFKKLHCWAVESPTPISQCKIFGNVHGVSQQNSSMWMKIWHIGSQVPLEYPKHT